jgi:hypothetical protein
VIVNLLYVILLTVILQNAKLLCSFSEGHSAKGHSAKGHSAKGRSAPYHSIVSFRHTAECLSNDSQSAE